jgi:hypothetical protein
MVTPLGNDAIILRRAIPGVRVVAGDWWDRIEISEGGEVTIVPAYHWSSRTGRDRRMALWSGFMLSTGAFSFSRSPPCTQRAGGPVKSRRRIEFQLGRRRRRFYQFGHQAEQSSSLLDSQGSVLQDEVRE